MRNGDLAPSEEHGTHTEKTSKGHLTFCSPSEREDLRMAPVVVSPLPAAPLGACAVNEDIVLGVLSNAAWGSIWFTQEGRDCSGVCYSYLLMSQQKAKHTVKPVTTEAEPRWLMGWVRNPDLTGNSDEWRLSGTRRRKSAVQKTEKKKCLKIGF